MTGICVSQDKVEREQGKKGSKRERERPRREGDQGEGGENSLDLVHDFDFLLSVHVLAELGHLACSILANVGIEATGAERASPFPVVEVLAGNLAQLCLVLIDHLGFPVACCHPVH